MTTDHVIMSPESGDLEALHAAEKTLNVSEYDLFEAAFIGAVAARISRAAWQEAIDSSLETIARRRTRELNACLKASIALEAKEVSR